MWWCFLFVYFWTNLCFSYVSFFFFFLSAFALAVSPRPKKSDIFYWASYFFFFFFFTRFGCSELNLLSGFVIESVLLWGKCADSIWKDLKKNIPQRNYKGHQRQRQILGKMKSAKGRVKIHSKCLLLQTGFVMTLYSHVPKLHDELNVRHFTQVTVFNMDVWPGELQGLYNLVSVSEITDGDCQWVICHLI